MKKIIKRVAQIIMICSVIVTTNANYLCGATQYAYSIGTDYSTLTKPNIDTSADATNAATAWGKCGYKSYYNIKPTASYLKGKAPDGKRRLGSSIVFLSGHGSSQMMSFNYKNKGGTYATGIIQGKNWKSKDTGYDYAGVASCNMSKTKLCVLAGCETAYGKNNIAHDVVSVGGASSSIGWIKSVDAESHTKWLKRFANKLASGATLRDATIYANSFSYSDYNVKTTWFYGNYNTTIVAASKKAKSVDSRKIKVEDKTKSISNKNMKELIIKQINANNNNYSPSDFKVITQGDIVDLIYLVNGYETECGYTIFIKNGKIKEIYDNMPTESLLKFNMTNLKTNVVVSKRFTQNCFIKEKRRIGSDYKITNQEGKIVYNIHISS